MPSPQDQPQLGCLARLVLSLVGLLLLTFLFSPWALHIGNRWTPLLNWHGSGKLHSSTGSDYPLFLDLSFSVPTSGNLHRTSNLRGTALLCTPKGQLFHYNLTGTVYAWLNTDGQKVILYLRSPSDAKPKLDFSLHGSWDGPQLLLDDHGSMVASFNPDGFPRGWGVGTFAPKENAQATVEFSDQSTFESSCRLAAHPGAG